MDAQETLIRDLSQIIEEVDHGEAVQLSEQLDDLYREFPDTTEEAKLLVKDAISALRHGGDRLYRTWAKISLSTALKHLVAESFIPANSPLKEGRYALIGAANPMPYMVAWQGTAADETAGVDPYAPLHFGFDAEKEAKAAAMEGETYPHSLLVGTPRIYRYDLLNIPSLADGKGIKEKGILNIEANPDWRSAFSGIAANVKGEDAVNDDSLLNPGAEKHFAAAESLEHLWRDLIDDARKLAKAEGYAAFELTGGLRSAREGGKSVPGMVFLTDPHGVKPVEEKVVGYLPGMPTEPAAEDLVLYHGGPRPLGAVGLDYRATKQGENLEPLPILRNTPAVWTKDEKREVMGYADARVEKCAALAGRTCVPHIYTLDAANAEVAEVITRDLTRRRANAVVRELLKRKAAERPDILRLQRTAGGQEYFIPKGGYNPTIVRAEDRSDYFDPVDIPPVQTIKGLPFATPSDEFCDAIDAVHDSAPGADIRDNAEHWEALCQGSKRWQGRGIPDPKPRAMKLALRYGEIVERTREPAHQAREEYYADVVVEGKPSRPAVQAILAAAPRPPGQDLRLKALAALEKDYEPPRPGRRSKGGRRGREKERPGKGGGALPSITIQG